MDEKKVLDGTAVPKAHVLPLHLQSEQRSTSPKASEYTSWRPYSPSSSQLHLAPTPRRTLPSSPARILFFLLASLGFLYWSSPYSSKLSSDPIDSILRATPLIDTHIDFPIFLRYFYHNQINNLTASDELAGQVDFPRLKKGKLGGVFWSVFVGCPEDNGDYADERYAEAVQTTFEQIDLVHRLVGRFPEKLSLTMTASAMFHNHQFPPEYQTIGSMIGGEGLHSIGNKVANLRLMHQLGMRYMTLTHNCHNIYADAAISPQPPLHNGLSTKGKALILEFNRLGMMVDLSHVSAATMRDALAISEAPVIFSHSGAYGVFAHPRNVPDDVLDLVKRNKGVVQAVFHPDFVSGSEANATMQLVADHIEYIGKRIGYEHVGIGSDYDGMFTAPKGLEDVSMYPDLLRELWTRGLSYKELSGVVGANVLRVLGEVEAVAVRSTRAPMEDEVSVSLPNGTAKGQ